MEAADTITEMKDIATSVSYSNVFSNQYLVINQNKIS